jgi:hypothetical protein
MLVMHQIPLPLILSKQLSPASIRAPLLGYTPVLQWPIKIVLLDLSDQSRKDHQGRPEDQLLEYTRWPIPSQPRQEAVGIPPYLKTPALSRHVVADQLNTAWVANTQTLLVS